jgi:hypothetical protein
MTDREREILKARYAKRVTKGAPFMDEKVPGWAARIAIDRLAMESCTDCIFGQLAGDYHTGMTMVDPYSKICEWEFGFTLHRNEQDRDRDSDEVIIRRFDVLGDCWRDAIRERLAQEVEA